MLDLEREDRLRLMRFVCSFAWADLEIVDKERELVLSLVEKLELDEDEAEMVQGWLKIPPLPEDVDPLEIPPQHRQLFLNVMMDMVRADGVIASDEIENFHLFEQLLR
ncbi:MAG: TerB family tellurite resistance protein [Proteobacteria bacterium]|nr:TerB family tellurite resistance protein [Pseudomonadota bacterium]